MMTLAKLTATVFGIGYMQKGAGTLAALFCCIAWYATGAKSGLTISSFVLTILVFSIGVWCASAVEKVWGHDSNRIVIDEVLGMQVALLFSPINNLTIVVAFLLFRFFDIVKPLFIRQAEKLPGGWGVMMDDLLAGIYANGALQLLLLLNVF